MQCLDNFYTFKKNSNDAADATSSMHNKKNYQTLGNGKFDFFGPPIPLLI